MKMLILLIGVVMLSVMCMSAIAKDNPDVTKPIISVDIDYGKVKIDELYGSLEFINNLTMKNNTDYLSTIESIIIKKNSVFIDSYLHPELNKPAVYTIKE